MTVQPNYYSIEAVRNICEPWIQLWDGDEWGDSMWNLHGACHTSYGFSDEDCALFASKLLENLVSQKEWAVDEGADYGFANQDEIAHVQLEARKQRDYWLNGGNIQSDYAVQAATETISKLPKWLFEGELS